MKTRSLLVAALAALALAGCAADPIADSDGVEERSSALQTEPTVPPNTVDCRLLRDASCYECGNKDGVYCCIGPCTIIPRTRKLSF